MNVFLEKLDSREKGTLPISVGTSLAIESLCGLGEFETKKPPIINFDSLWINVRTLFRNCYGSIDKDSKGIMKSDVMVEGLVSDMLTILSTISNQTSGRVRVIFYYDTYKSFNKKFPNAKQKEPSTDKQILEHYLEESTIKLLLSNQNDIDIKVFDCELNSRDKRTAIITHYVSDLLSRKHFIDLVLLESHTGSFKTKTEWNTKLTGGNKLPRIPFNRLTIQVYGDGNTLFHAMLPSIKKVITEIAEKDKWNPTTSLEKIRFSLNKMKDKEQREFFLSLL